MAAELKVARLGVVGAAWLALAPTACQRPDALPGAEVFLPGLEGAAAAVEAVSWPAVGNDPGGMRFSGLDQINRTSVFALNVVADIAGEVPG